MQRPSQNWNEVSHLSLKLYVCVLEQWLWKSEDTLNKVMNLACSMEPYEIKRCIQPFQHYCIISICSHLLQVSLDSRVREVINRNLLDPSPHMYEDAQLQIYTLMHRDSFPRFLNSQIYKSLVESITGSTSET